MLSSSAWVDRISCACRPRCACLAAGNGCAAAFWSSGRMALSRWEPLATTQARGGSAQYAPSSHFALHTACESVSHLCLAFVSFCVTLWQALAYLSPGAGRLAVMPSRVENAPLAVVECATLGIPFLASDVGGGTCRVYPKPSSPQTPPPASAPRGPAPFGALALPPRPSACLGRCLGRAVLRSPGCGGSQ